MRLDYLLACSAAAVGVLLAASVRAQERVERPERPVPDSLEVTMTLLPEDAVDPDTITRRIEVPRPQAAQREGEAESGAADAARAEAVPESENGRASGRSSRGTGTAGGERSAVRPDAPGNARQEGGAERRDSRAADPRAPRVERPQAPVERPGSRADTSEPAPRPERPEVRSDRPERPAERPGPRSARPERPESPSERREEAREQGRGRSQEIAERARNFGRDVAEQARESSGRKKD